MSLTTSVQSEGRFMFGLFIPHPHLRFALKLATAIMIALFVGYNFELETPRWAVMTAAIIGTSPAMVAGGEPYYGAIVHRSLLRLGGTFIGCVMTLGAAALFIRAPFVMIILLCIWAGFCVWLSTVTDEENTYLWSLGGYTTMIMMASIHSDPSLTPLLIVERCSEISVGIICSLLAEVLFHPRSVRQDIDKISDDIIQSHYRLMQLTIVNSVPREEVEKKWAELSSKTKKIKSLGHKLTMETYRNSNADLRMKRIMSQLPMLQVAVAEMFLIKQESTACFSSEINHLFTVPRQTEDDLLSLIHEMQLLSKKNDTLIPEALLVWTLSLEKVLCNKQNKGISGNLAEESRLEDVRKTVKAVSANYHEARINFLRTSLSCLVASLLWIWTGWSAGAGLVIVVAIVTSLAVSSPNPKAVAADFAVGMCYALPVSALYFLWIFPQTQQSFLLLCASMAFLAFILGWAIQRRIMGSMGALLATINVLVLSNPMSFNFSSFINNSASQIIGSVLAYLIIILVPQYSGEKTKLSHLNSILKMATESMTSQNNKNNYLPSLYYHVSELALKFPKEIFHFRIAMNLVIAHGRLSKVDIPSDKLFSPIKKRINRTVNSLSTASSHTKRGILSEQLITDISEYYSLLGSSSENDWLRNILGSLIKNLKINHSRIFCE